jgi:hypothetical protein
VIADPSNSQETAKAGLCAACVHAKRIESDRNSIFWLCGLASTDSRFPKYPRLPVVRCAGHARHPAKPNS